jgi:hypothetical protein
VLSIHPLNIIAQIISRIVLNIPIIPFDFNKLDLSSSGILNTSFMSEFILVKLISAVIAFKLADSSEIKLFLSKLEISNKISC